MTADKGRVQTETAKPTEPTETAKPTEPEAPTASAQTEHGGLPGDVNGDGVVDIDDQRLPWVTRAYGAVLLVQGLLTVPMIVIAFMHAVGTALGGASFEPGDLTSILSWISAVLSSVTTVVLMVFGALLALNRRKHAARWTYVLIPMTFAEGVFAVMVDGFGPHLLPTAAQILILVALSVTVDPALLEERRLQRALKRMNDKEAYDKAVKAGMLGRDPSGKGYIELNFFNIFWLFTVACVFGLIIETVYHFAIYHGELQDRAGLLWGPFSPIYGCGAVLVTAALNRLWKSNPFLVFCASAVIGGAFEYATSWFMEVAFGITAWDYTGQWLSIDGRTSGKYMFFWGVIGVVWVRWILPHMLRLINRIPWKVRYSLTVACAALMLVDIVFTLMALDCWYGRLAGLPQDSPVVQWFAAHYDDAFMAGRFQTMSIDPAKAGRL